MKLICNNTNLEQNPLHPEMVNLINALTDPDPASRPAADEAYRLINRIPSLHVNANDSTHPSDFIAYTVSLHDVLRLGQAKILLDQFARQLVRQGAKSIALMGDVSKVEQAELVYIQRALQKAGILHIAPLVYSTRAGLHVAEKAAENYYNATFRTPQTTLLCSREIAKNILKSKQQGIHASGVFSTPHPPNKVLPVRPSSGRQNSK